MALNGIDISSHQGALDLDHVTYDFVMIKATQGVDYVNPNCDKHFQEAKAAGKKRALYHYADGHDAIAEADHFVDNCAGYIRDAIFVLDWEGAGVEFTDWADKFASRVEERIGYPVAIYMSEWVENNYNWNAFEAKNRGLIMAKYSDYEIDNNYDTSSAGKAPVAIHWPFYFMWQWTSKGRLSGYAGDLDCDIAYLTPKQWDAYAGYVPPTTTTTTTEEPITTTTTTELPVPEPPAPHELPDPEVTTATTTEPTPIPVRVAPPLPQSAPQPLLRLPALDSATFKGIVTFIQANVPILLVWLMDPTTVVAISQYAPWLLPTVTTGAGIAAFILGLMRKDVKTY